MRDEQHRDRALCSSRARVRARVDDEGSGCLEQVSDSLGDVRAWTLVAAVAIGYIVSRGLAKSGTKYTGGEDPLNRNNN